MRFFRTASDAAYEQIRARLNSEWGLPNDTGTVTCIPPAETVTRDASGRILLPLKEMFLEWEPAASLLPQLVASGIVEEIDDGTYQSAVSRPVP